MTSSLQHDRGVNDEFVRLLTECQDRLYVYILSLLPDRDRAKDVLQDTNVVMWRKAEEFEPGTSFDAWACKIAYFEVLSERRRQQRDRLQFDEVVLEKLASEVPGSLKHLNDRAVALEDCLQRLAPDQRQRLGERYRSGGSVKEIAERTGQTPSAIAVSLYRIRAALFRCIQSKLAEETVQ